MAEFMSGLSMLPSVENVLTILIGTFLGIVVGAIPGLTPAVGMVKKACQCRAGFYGLSATRAY